MQGNLWAAPERTPPRMRNTREREPWTVTWRESIVPLLAPPADPVPPSVKAHADDFAAALGRPITITPVNSRTWELAVEENGVRATAVYKQKLDGAYRYDHGTLTVNGNPRQAMDVDQLRHLLDGTRPDPVDPDPEPVDPAMAPREVRRHVNEVRDKLDAAPNAEWFLARHGRGYQIVLRNAASKFDMRVYFHKYRNRWHQWAPKGPSIRASLDGLDYSAEVNGDITAALALMNGSGDGDPGNPATIGTPQAAKANTSVQTRRATVIRV